MTGFLFVEPLFGKKVRLNRSNLRPLRCLYGIIGKAPKFLFLLSETDMQKNFLLFLLVGLSLSACGLRSTPEPPTPTATTTATATQPPPTETPLPTLTATVTPTPTPDFTIIGLPREPTNTLAFDFVQQMCQAQWFTEVGDLPCPGKETLDEQIESGLVTDEICEDRLSTEAGDLSCLGNEAQASTGFVRKLSGTIQGLPANINMLLTFPPPTNVGMISSKYPAFLVQKGDRFRTVLACRAHTFCDVEFFLSAFNDEGQIKLTHWRYIFADPPIVVDYAIDSLAGQTVQFDLSVEAKGNQADANAVWIAPHIYRPSN
jgi:hypothetical protein